jgi:hypothetical protein
MESQSPSREEPEPVQAPAPAEQKAAPVLGLEYGNRSTRATLQLDMGSEDIQVEMTGSPARRDTSRTEPRAQVVQVAAPTAPVPPPAAAPQPPVCEDSLLARARRLVDSAVRAATKPQVRDSSARDSGSARPSVPDSVTRQVVAEIRKAQESFYKGRYQESAEHAERSIAIHSTAEGHALAGSICWVRKDRECARRHWLQARALDPDFPGLSAMLDQQEAAP